MVEWQWEDEKEIESWECEKWGKTKEKWEFKWVGRQKWGTKQRGDKKEEENV